MPQSLEKIPRARPNALDIRHWANYIFFMQTMQTSNFLRMLACALFASPFVMPRTALCLDSDWPMWRHDARRSAAAPHALPDNLQLHWTRRLPEPSPAWPRQEDDFGHKLDFDLSYEPVAAGGLLYIGSMTADRLTAYDIETGAETWRHYADGPVRLAPAVWDGRVYFASDDGRLYCLDAASGAELWRFSGGPSPRTVLGNGRLISAWPARGGPVIADGTVYFGAGIWPFDGVFIHALDAKTGEAEWSNSGAGSHNRGGVLAGGVSPHGCLAVALDGLVVPNGRAAPAVFDRSGGSLMYCRQSRPEVGMAAGGYRVYSHGEWFFNESPDANSGSDKSIRTERATHVYSLRDGAQFGSENIQVLSDSLWIGVEDNALVAFSPEVETAGRRLAGLDRNAVRSKPNLRKLWKTQPVEGLARAHLSAGATVYGSGPGGNIFAIDVESYDDADREDDAADDESLSELGLGSAEAEVKWTARVDGEVFSMLAARDRLFAVTEQGGLYCFGPGERAPVEHVEKNTPLPEPDSDSAGRAQLILGRLERADGYLLALGAGAGGLLDALASSSDMRIVVVEPDAARVLELRRRFDDAGIYGRRVAIVHAEPAGFRFPPYIADAVVLEDPGLLGQPGEAGFAAALFHPLRPYGGTAFLPLPEAQRAAFAAAVEQAGLENAEIEHDGEHVLLRRAGRLPGAGQWTHEYADAANTKYSADCRVKAPLSVVWFGGTENNRVLPRHGNGPVPHVTRGRLVIMGPDHLTARCVYTGRELWQVELPGVGRNFNSTGHQAGANYIGSPYVSTENEVYVIHADKCLRLDLKNGETLSVFEMPERGALCSPEPVADEAGQSYAAAIVRDWWRSSSPKGLDEAEAFKWGSIRVWADLLVVCAYPHRFDSSIIGWGKSWNNTSSEFLVAMDRFSGEVKWAVRARYGFRHNAVAAGNGRIFAADNLSGEILSRLARRGIEPDATPEIRAYDARSGRVEWAYSGFVFGTFLGYSEKHDALIQAGRPNWTGRYATHRLPDEPHDAISALRGADGVEMWRATDANLLGPPALHLDEGRIIAGMGGDSMGLLTGEPLMRPHPVSGEVKAWRYGVAGHGCGSQNLGRHIIAFRAGTAAYHDLVSDKGDHLGGFKSGCTDSMIPADGILNAPDYTRTCKCAFTLQTSLGLAYRPEVDLFEGVKSW